MSDLTITMSKDFRQEKRDAVRALLYIDSERKRIKFNITVLERLDDIIDRYVINLKTCLLNIS